MSHIMQKVKNHQKSAGPLQTAISLTWMEELCGCWLKAYPSCDDRHQVPIFPDTGCFFN